jgi:hypothetical protein
MNRIHPFRRAAVTLVCLCLLPACSETLGNARSPISPSGIDEHTGNDLRHERFKANPPHPHAVKEQVFEKYEGIEIPKYPNHTYKSGSVAAQPGVRIYTPTGNVIIVSIRDPNPSDKGAIDPAKDMNGWVSAAMSAYPAESIVANVTKQHGFTVITYDIWRKNIPGSEVQTPLPQLISASRKIYFPTLTVSIESLLCKGDINSDLETIRNFTKMMIAQYADRHPARRLE